jgi:anti-anti-sigma regulatory factor
MTRDTADASCTSRYVGDVLLVCLGGRIAGATGAALLDWLPVTGRAATPHVVVSLTDVTSIDRAGADSLVDACLATALRRGILVLAGPTAPVYDSLRHDGVFRTVEVFTDDDVAVETVGRRQASAVRAARRGVGPRAGSERQGSIIDRGAHGLQPDGPSEPLAERRHVRRVR